MINAKIEVKQDSITIKVDGEEFKLFNEADNPIGYYFAIEAEELDRLKELNDSKRR